MGKKKEKKSKPAKAIVVSDRVYNGLRELREAFEDFLYSDVHGMGTEIERLKKIVSDITNAELNLPAEAAHLIECSFADAFKEELKHHMHKVEAKAQDKERRKAEKKAEKAQKKAKDMVGGSVTQP